MTLVEFKSTFDPKLEKFLSTKISSAKTLLADDFLIELLEQLKVIVLSGGKRVRPYVTQTMYQAAGGKSDITPYLQAIELFHVFCLIHDDIMDKGTIRHYVETINQFTYKKLSTDRRHGDFSHIANSQAILVGDLLNTWVHELWQTPSDIPLSEQLEARRYFLTMSEQVILGQMIDVDIMSRESVTQELLIQKMLLKTARYTFVEPMKIGAALSGASDDYLSFCDRFGEAIGLGFQIHDDILDFAENATGKRPFSDLTERQHTLMTWFIQSQASKEYQDELANYFSHTITEKSVPAVLELFEKSGALVHAQTQAKQYFQKAKDSLHQSPFSDEQKKHWQQLVELIEMRTH